MKPKSNYQIRHWGANLPPIRTRNIHRREIHFRAVIIAIALAGLAIGSFAMVVTKAAESARKEARP